MLSSSVACCVQYGLLATNASHVFGHVHTYYSCLVCMHVALSDGIIYLGGKMLDTASVDSVCKPLFFAR